MYNLSLDPPTVSREKKPVIPPRVDRTKKPSSTLPPHFNGSEMLLNGMPGHKYYNVLDDPSAHYSEPPPPRPSYKGKIQSSKSFDFDPRYNNCPSPPTYNTPPPPYNYSTNHSPQTAIRIQGGNNNPTIGSVVQLQLDISTRHLDNTRPVPSPPQSSYENSGNIPSTTPTSPYENSPSHHRGSISSSTSSSSSSSVSSKASYENDDAFAPEGDEGKYSNVPTSPTSLVRKLSFIVIIITFHCEIFQYKVFPIIL